MPSRTFLHKVAAENGKGVGKLGRLGSRTSWDRRAYAVSAISSKLGIVSVTRRVMGWRGLLEMGLRVIFVSVIVCFRMRSKWAWPLPTRRALW